MALGMLVAAALLSGQGTVQLSGGLVIGGMAKGGRTPVTVDFVQDLLCQGTWLTPTLGGKLAGPDAEQHAWEAAKPNADGWVESPLLEIGGYYWATYDSPAREVMLLSAEGDTMAYVNGTPRAGDPYGWGSLHLPFVARQGVNTFLFSCSRGHVRAKIERPRKPVAIDATDATLPDALDGDRELWGAIVVVNATEKRVVGARLGATLDGNFPLEEKLPELPALSVRKVPFRFLASTLKGDKAELHFQLSAADGTAIDRVALPVRVRKGKQTHKRTFVSAVDGSVQYYALNPAERPSKETALIMSLHGAGVEAIGQADAYASKSWATLVCPTNRRPYGFDWEDWGQIDAFEALTDAGKRYPHDPRRTSLTGHSMGGHGAWHLGVTYPDRFAAVGPSAGWVSFASYAGGLTIDEPSGPEKAMLAATSPSDTLALGRNTSSMGVYVLHGDKDDNVPVTEARSMRAALAGYSSDFNYLEQPGAGHWWSNSDEPGAACVDWPAMFDVFARHRIPAPQEVRDIEFRTAAPNASARSQWVTVEQQQRPFQISSVKAHLDPHLRRFTLTTENVAALTLAARSALGDDRPVTVVVDGQALKDVTLGGGRVTLYRKAGGWVEGGPVAISQKRPERGGGFKNALRKRFLLVYGTTGTPEENLWMRNKARFDAETFLYRGNGSVDVVSDKEFNPASGAERDLMLYGNRDLNALWRTFAKGSDVDVLRGEVHVGDSVRRGDDLACLFCRPSSGKNTMVAFVGVTGTRGMRMAERLPYFTSGVAYPDYTVISAEALRTGTKGIVDAGWFGNDWALPKPSGTIGAK